MQNDIQSFKITKVKSSIIDIEIVKKLAKLKSNSYLLKRIYMKIKMKQLVLKILGRLKKL